MPKKYRKFMPKGAKIMPKGMPKSMIFHTFSKKAKTLQTLCFPINRSSGHTKSDENSIIVNAER